MSPDRPAAPGADDEALRLALRLRLNTNRLRRVVQAAGDDGGLPRSQETVLGQLERNGPLTTADLARREQLRPQTMGAVVAELVAAGLVSKTPHPTDGRRELVQLTVRGRETAAAVSAVRDRDLARLLATRLDGRQRDTLARALEILESLTSPPGRSDGESDDDDVRHGR